MKAITALSVEFLILFILLPICLALPILVWVKITLVVIGFGYLLWVLKQQRSILKRKVDSPVNWRLFAQRVTITFLGVTILTSLYVWYLMPTALFFVPIHKPLLFLAIVFVYSVFSVWPQELVYRTFFINRYTALFKNKTVLVLVNALVFSLAHLFFKNILVLVLTFLGGIIFALTYLKFKSTLLVSLEHALYGSWIYAVGMGQMLAFPGME